MPTTISDQEQYWINELKVKYPNLADTPIRLNEYTVYVLDNLGVENTNLNITKGYYDESYTFHPSRSYAASGFNGNIDLKTSVGFAATLSKQNGFDVSFGTTGTVDSPIIALDFDILDLGFDGENYNPTVRLKGNTAEFGDIDTRIDMSVDANGMLTGEFVIEGGEKFKFATEGSISTDENGNHYFHQRNDITIPAKIAIFNQVGFSAERINSEQLSLVSVQDYEFRGGDDGFFLAGEYLKNHVFSVSDVIFDLVNNEYASHFNSFNLSHEELSFLIAREQYNCPSSYKMAQI